MLPLHNSASPFLLYNFRDVLTIGAEGRTRTDTRVAPQQFLRLPRLPFRHFGRYEVVHRRTVNGAEAQIRTGDTRIFSPLLYHLSYLGIMGIVGFLLL